MPITRFSMLLLAIAALSACNKSDPQNQSGNDGGSMDSSQPPPGGGGGTCSTPIDLAQAGTNTNGVLTFMGSTANAQNVLHPNPGCAMHDDNEVVFVYHVPNGVTAAKISTDGSDFNTVLYARASCDQPSNPMDVMDLSCNDDDFDHPPQSTIFLTALTSPSDVFIVVDGNADAAANMQSSNGNFVLTLTPVTPGSANAPCIPADDMHPTPTCNNPLGCSLNGGAPDGTQICVPIVNAGQSCDNRGYLNTCAMGTTCAQDPSPPDGTTPDAVCALPGTSAGAPCRMNNPRCDAPLVCGAGDTPDCVRVLNEGDPCDPMGFSNQCPTGTHCLPSDDAGNATCQ